MVGIVARALHVLGKSSFMALCSMVVLITWFLGVVASQTATDTAEVRERTDVTFLPQSRLPLSLGDGSLLGSVELQGLCILALKTHHGHFQSFHHARTYLVINS